MKLAVAFLLTTIVLLVGTATAVEEDVYSLIFAKLDQLESKVANNKLITTPARRITKRSVNVADRATSECPPPVVTYTRWGNSSCPFGANTVYGGVAAGDDKDHQGSPANLLCLPPTPMHYSNNAGAGRPIYGVEYQTGGPLNHADDRNVPCAVCEVKGKSTTLMIPSHYECPTGWHHEYNGYIMAGNHGEEGASMYNCIDVGLEQIPGTGSDRGWHYLYPTYVAASGDSLPYDNGYAMSCVVCSK